MAKSSLRLAALVAIGMCAGGTGAVAEPAVAPQAMVAQPAARFHVPEAARDGYRVVPYVAPRRSFQARPFGAPRWYGRSGYAGLGGWYPRDGYWHPPGRRWAADSPYAWRYGPQQTWRDYPPYRAYGPSAWSTPWRWRRYD